MQNAESGRLSRVHSAFCIHHSAFPKAVSFCCTFRRLRQQAGFVALALPSTVALRSSDFPHPSTRVPFGSLAGGRDRRIHRNAFNYTRSRLDEFVRLNILEPAWPLWT